MKFKVGDRVIHTDRPFLSAGEVVKVVVDNYYGQLFGYVVKLDEFAPNEYVFNTDEVFAFPEYLQLEGQ